MSKEIYRGYLSDKEFEVENAIHIHAKSYCFLPARYIYDEEKLGLLKEVHKSSHIYLIGYLPKIYIKESYVKNDAIVIECIVRGENYSVSMRAPINVMNRMLDELGYYLPKLINDRYQNIDFEVKYIGQAYGANGNRNAIDRLQKHETLQRIALKGVPDGYELSLLLLEVEANPMLATSLNPFAKVQGCSDDRMRAGIDQLFSSTEAERVSLYEASLIRYFYPEFNKEFKNSFPSRRMKLLKECYEKDFSAVISEINFGGDMPYRLFSDSVKPSASHLINFDLHNLSCRKVFYS